MELNDITAKYGWTVNGNNVYNRKGTHVVVIECKGDRYTFKDTSGNKLMTGKGQITVSLERLLTSYYFCTPITNL